MVTMILKLFLPHPPTPKTKILIIAQYCIRKLSRGGMYWVVQCTSLATKRFPEAREISRGPRDFPRPERCPRLKSEENLLVGREDVQANTSRFEFTDIIFHFWRLYVFSENLRVWGQMKHFYCVALWTKKENLARYENLTLTVYHGKGSEKQIFPRQEMEKRRRRVFCIKSRPFNFHRAGKILSHSTI